ncbi:hypothetical protein COU60_03290 [Candidatus Pacearchaeota archaeon CG10_big_fil_rev_8_21_14_0_10_34_76]|nr:MAG: hypothetical protein COU60_03290 [Candidatus Pacearchaeota archaeon CG10_big_fil_rev_8_21_14_0_10_34_76]
MKEDIMGGIRNALERGIPLDIAIQSFINAGYSEKEVRDAAREVNVGIITKTPEMQVNPQTDPAKNAKLNNTQIKQDAFVKPLDSKSPPAQPNIILKKPKKKGLGLAAFLSILLFLLIGVFVFSLIFQDKVVSALKSIIGT